MDFAVFIVGDEPTVERIRDEHPQARVVVLEHDVKQRELEQALAIVGDFPDDGLDLEQVERRLVEQALAKADWNVTRAARLLNLTRDTLRYRIEKFGLAPPAVR